METVTWECSKQLCCWRYWLWSCAVLLFSEHTVHNLKLYQPWCDVSVSNIQIDFWWLECSKGLMRLEVSGTRSCFIALWCYTASFFAIVWHQLLSFSGNSKMWSAGNSISYLLEKSKIVWRRSIMIEKWAAWIRLPGPPDNMAFTKHLSLT